MHLRLLSAVSVTFALVAQLSASPARAQTTQVFEDSVFSDSDWSLQVEILNGGGTVNAFQVPAGGVPGEYRRIDNTLFSAAGTGTTNTVFGFHSLAGAVHDPSVDGALLALDYSEDAQRIAGGIQAGGVALRQNGVVYYGPQFLTPTTFGVWAPQSFTGLLASDFDALAPGTQHPDFSAAGGPIEFGFYRGNSTSVGGSGGTTSGAIDNWRVVLVLDAPVSVAPASWGAVKSAYER